MNTRCCPLEVRSIVDTAINATDCTTNFDSASETNALRIHYTPQRDENAYAADLLSLSWYLVGRHLDSKNELERVASYLITNNT